jgi:hypothetical protein
MCGRYGQNTNLVFKTGEYAPYSHNLVFLFSKLELLASKEHFEALARFSQYNLSTRYQEDKKAFLTLANKDLANAEARVAKELLTWISSL